MAEGGTVGGGARWGGGRRGWEVEGWGGGEIITTSTKSSARTGERRRQRHQWRQKKTSFSRQKLNQDTPRAEPQPNANKTLCDRERWSIYTKPEEVKLVSCSEGGGRGGIAGVPHFFMCRLLNPFTSATCIAHKFEAGFLLK